MTPFAHRLGRDTGQTSGPFGSAKAIDDVVDGWGHGEGLAEITSAAKIDGRAAEIKSIHGGWWAHRSTRERFLRTPRAKTPTQAFETVIADVDRTTENQYLMQDGIFEWDDQKAASNWVNHHVDFEMAREAFKDPFSVEWVDGGQNVNEERFSMVAMVESRLLFVAYALRGDRIRIISARKPEPNERRKYHNENRQT